MTRLAVTELLILYEDGVKIPKRSLDALKPREGKDISPREAVAFLKSNFDELLGLEQTQYNDVRKESADFINIFNALERMVEGRPKPSDFAVLQASADKQKEYSSPNRPEARSLPVPLVDKGRIAELMRLIAVEAQKNSDFLFFKMFNNTPSVIEDPTKSWGLLPGAPKTLPRTFDIDTKISIVSSGKIKSISSDGTLECHSKGLGFRPRDRVAVDGTDHFNGTYQILSVNDDGTIHFKFEGDVRFKTETAGYCSRPESIVYASATEMNSRRGASDFRCNVLQKIQSVLGESGDLDHVINLKGSKLTKRGTPLKEKSLLCALVSDPLTGDPTSIDVETVIRLGGSLEAEVKLVPEWQSGGKKNVSFSAALMRGKMDALFAAYAIHSNVGIQVGGQSKVSTLYDLVMLQLDNELALAKDGNDEKQVKSVLDKMRLFCSGPPDSVTDKKDRGKFVNACPWIRAPKLSTGFDSVLSQSESGSRPYKLYSGRTVEAGLMLSKSIIFLTKSYCNACGILRSPQDGKGLASTLSLGGTHIVDLLLDAIVARLLKTMGAYKLGGNKSALNAFTKAKDKSAYLFGADKETIRRVAVDSVGDNIRDLFVAGSGMLSFS